jgi:hypothetical protein
MKHPAWFGLPIIVLCIGSACTAAEITPVARELAAVIDSMRQTLLANAQYDWLADEGRRRGWQRLGGDADAQDYANRGYLVVATYKNHHDEKPGHIAIVRPDAAKSASELRAEGPQITQAGGTNYRSTTLKQGFADHPAAWGLHEVRYYAHSVDAPIGDPPVSAR